MLPGIDYQVIKFPMALTISLDMTQFFSKGLAENVGYGIATEIATVAADLQTDSMRMIGAEIPDLPSMGR